MNAFSAEAVLASAEPVVGDIIAAVFKVKKEIPLKGALPMKRILAITRLCTTVAPAALMSLNMLIETVGGRNYTAAELRAWLQDIGSRGV